MLHFKRRQPWELPESRTTGERQFWSRRKFLMDLGIAGLGGAAMIRGLGRAEASAAGSIGPAATPEPFDATARIVRPSNFIEFSHWNAEVPKLARHLPTEDWTVSVSGLVERPLRVAAGELQRLLYEEQRIYRFRCVEGWAMVVPWSGFALRRLLERVRPTGAARYVRFVGFHEPAVAPAQQDARAYRFPCTEVLSLAEAGHELSFIATGAYGRELPKEHGAPLRLIVPWKYAIKSLKSITRIELLADRPETFWQQLHPGDWIRDCNVCPDDRIAGISQSEEIVLGTGEWQPTRPFNGYSELVGSLYA